MIVSNLMKIRSQLNLSLLVMLTVTGDLVLDVLGFFLIAKPSEHGSIVSHLKLHH